MTEPTKTFREEVRATKSLRPDPRNARTHSDVQVRQIADLILAYGWTFPPLVDGTGMIIAGHGRWKAAQLLGLEEMPVRVADGWSDEAQRVYILADNKVPLGAGWDDELHAIELGDLQDAGVDLALAGFNSAELEAVLGPTEESIASAHVVKIDTAAVADVFWIQVSGPLADQADVLQKLRAIERDHGAVEVRLGTTPRDG